MDAGKDISGGCCCCLEKLLVVVIVLVRQSSAGIPLQLRRDDRAVWLLRGIAPQ